MMEELLNQLNDNQREAALYTGGPELVIAGAGSGKTRVLTYKIAYLLQQGTPPYSILALTFTNKAAREMKERIVTLAGTSKAHQLWMGTFHSVFSRILRIEAGMTGYPSHFTIYDSADSKNLLKSIIREMKLDDKVYRPGMVQARISGAKNALVTWRMYGQNKELIEGDMHARVPAIRDVYRLYQSRCFQAGAMDFDDLLLQTNILFRDHPEVLKKYQEHFSYILVDEYQDTNSAQHLIVRQLSEIRRRICVVGDDAQSIYSFRGANIDNVLQLKTVYPDLRIFKLEQNYRSTQNIVDAANSLIHKNKGQIPKTVYSEKEKGSKVALASTYSDYEEAYTVAFKIDELRMGGGRYSYADFAVLYRTNAQSRTLEEALRKRNIPYKIYGGLSFYQRKEVKDIIAYLRLVVNPHDEEALKRTINYPARGIGEATLEKLTVAASENNASLWAVLERPDLYALQLTGGTLKKLAAFKEMIDEFIRQNEVLQADEMTSFVIKKSGVAGELLQDRSVEGLGRQENMEELLTGIAEYIDVQREEGRERITLADFLSEVSLLTDQDNDKAENANRVTLMTVHAAKGLEFKNVFIVGLEEDLFPMLMSKDSVKAIEEERRLFYVAITRAGENCILTYARSRFRNGRSNLCSPSRFIKDIDPKYLHAPGEDTRESAFAKREQTRAPAFASPFRQPQATEPAAPALPEQTELPAGVSELKAGMKVRHDRFGAGEIMAIEGIGGNIRATVQFANFGQKQLLLKFARLTIIK